MKNFNELPQETQEKAKDTLRAYDKVNVIFENGKYNVSAGICIKKEYAIDHEFIGTYNANDIFTKDEKIINYIESFLSYPIEYTGNKNWDMLGQMKELRKEGKQAKIVLVNNTAMINEIIEIKF